MKLMYSKHIQIDLNLCDISIKVSYSKEYKIENINFLSHFSLHFHTHKNMTNFFHFTSS